jgi:hypothetical protein
MKGHPWSKVMVAHGRHTWIERSESYILIPYRCKRSGDISQRGRFCYLDLLTYMENNFDGNSKFRLNFVVHRQYTCTQV